MEQKNKVVKIIDRQSRPSAMSWSLKQVLNETLEEIKRGEHPDVGMVISVDRSNGGFVSWWKKAGLLNSEAVALLEIVKSELIGMLRDLE